jgi:hypothetical protein
VQICPECHETQWSGVTKCVACGAVLTGIPADAVPAREPEPEREAAPVPGPELDPEPVSEVEPEPESDPEPAPVPALEPVQARRARPVVAAPEVVPSRRRGVMIGVGLAVAVAALIAVIAFGGRSEEPHHLTWATRITPLGVARVSLPDDCRLTPPRDGHGGKLGALDCWLNVDSEVGVLEAHLTTPGVDAMTVGIGMVQRMLHGSVDSVGPSGKQDGTEFDMKGHGLVASRDAMLSAHLVIHGDDVVVIFGIGLGQMPPSSLQRAVTSIHLV